MDSNRRLPDVQGESREFAQTNLRGYDGTQKLIVDFFEGDSTAKADRILRITGFAVNREVTLSDGSLGDLAYGLRHLYIGRKRQ